VLGTTFGGKPITLAQLPLTVLTLAFDVLPGVGSNVLALVSCKDDEAANDPACITRRAQEISGLLSAIEVQHKVVSDQTAFRHGLRSGRYNTYWLSGRQDKLDGTLAQELREAVFNGNGLLVDGEHDERNGVLDAVSGVRWRGKFGPVDLQVDLNGVVFPAGRIATVGRADRLELDGGTPQAEFNAGVPRGGAPAIISNLYGAGRAVQFAFDVPASSAANSEWQPLVVKALQYVQLPYTGMLAPGQQVPVSFAVTNLGPHFVAHAASLLPQGSDYVGSSGGGTFDSDTRAIHWDFELDTHAEWRQGFTFAAPLTAGHYTVINSVGTIDPAVGQAQPYGTPRLLAFEVRDAVADANKAITVTGTPCCKERDTSAVT
jgi:hypothetical protein